MISQSHIRTHTYTEATVEQSSHLCVGGFFIKNAAGKRVQMYSEYYQTLPQQSAVTGENTECYDWG